MNTNINFFQNNIVHMIKLFRQPALGGTANNIASLQGKATEENCHIIASSGIAFTMMNNSFCFQITVKPAHK